MAKYIALSDIHLGQNHSAKIENGQFCLLSRISPEHPQAYARARVTMRSLADRVAAFAAGESVTLVIVGDLLDLSLAFVRESLVDLLAMLKELPAVDQIVYVIGNHDHHIWSLHSEWERSLGRMAVGELPLSGSTYRATDKNGERHHMLTELCTKQLERPIEVKVAYPSFAFEQDPVGPGQGALYYFTHGHLFGGLYTTFSDILKHELENRGLDHEQVAATVNGPLIEFIYWSLSQAGEGMGADGLMEQVYADLQAGDDGEIEHLIKHAVEVLIPDGLVPLVPDSLEHWVIVAAITHMIKKSEHRLTGSRSRDRHSDIDETRARLLRWVELAGLSKERETYLIYGHTHVADDWTLPDTRLRSFNMGSWLVESGHNDPETRLLFIDTDSGSLSFENL